MTEAERLARLIGVSVAHVQEHLSAGEWYCPGRRMLSVPHWVQGTAQRDVRGRRLPCPECTNLVRPKGNMAESAKQVF